MLALRAPPPKMYEPWLKNYRVGYGTTQGTYGYVRYFKPEEQPGVQAPLGYWDPLGLSKPNEQGDVDEELFFRRRVAEIKHGRVAMLACVGYIVPYFSKFPGSLTLDGSVPFADVPLGIKALTVVPPFGLAQILLLGATLELGPFQQEGTTSDDNTATFKMKPGNVKFDPLNLRPKDEDELLARVNAEIANGRLAMMAIMGFLVQDVLNDGNPYVGSPFEQFLK